MKSIFALSAILLLLNVQETQAVTLNSGFVDEIAKALAESEAKEEEADAKKNPAPAAPPKPAQVKK